MYQAKSSMRMETFGFSFAEDGAAFVPDEILGKCELGTVQPRAFFKMNSHMQHLMNGVV